MHDFNLRLLLVSIRVTVNDALCKTNSKWFGLLECFVIIKMIKCTKFGQLILVRSFSCSFFIAKPTLYLSAETI